MFDRQADATGQVRLQVAIAVMAASVAGFAPGLAGPGIEPNLDLQLEQDFLTQIQKEAAALEPNQRLVASRKYVATGDGAYNVYAILDTAGPETLKTERYQLELRQASGKKWRVVDKHLEDSTERLFRESDEAKQFFRFGSFRFEREGLRVTAAEGTALAYHFQGAISRIVLAAGDLEHDYAPPKDLGTRFQLYQAMEHNWNDELVFSPELVEIACHPALCRDLLSAFSGLEEIGPESLSETLTRYYRDRSEKLRKEQTKQPFSRFRLPYRDDARSFDVAIKKESKDQWIALKYNSNSGHEVRFRADGIGTIYGYPGEDSRSNLDPAVIEQRDDDDGALYQVTRITGEVEIGVLEPELLQADLEFTLEAKRDIDAIPFSIDAILVGAVVKSNVTFHVNELENGEGQALSWIRRGDSDGIVLLPELVPAGSRIVVHIEFQTKGSVIKINPSYSYMARSGWLPFVRYHDKIEDFELSITVPSRYKVLGMGSNVSRERQGKTNVSRWVARSSIHFPTVIFGDYAEDAPKTKALKIDGTEIPVTVHVDRSSLTDWGIRPTQLRSPGEIAVNALNIYRVLFGVDYPYGKLDLVNDPLEALGAQAPASIVYLGSAIFRSQATLSTAWARDTTTLVEERISHEVAHQWWGSLVSSANQRNYWFVESLAEYSSALFMEILASDGYRMPEKGRNAYLRMVKRWRDEILESNLLSSVQDTTSLWSNGGRTAAIYSRGPYAFHMLRQTFGDEKFFAFLKELAVELGGKEIVTRDIQRTAERSFGGIGPDGQRYTVDLEWFFDQWIRGVGIPEYTFEYTHRPAEGGGYVVEGTIRQRVFVGRHDIELDGVFYRGVVPVTVFAKGKQEYTSRIVVEGPTTPFTLKLPAKPLEVTLNKYGDILARRVRPAR